MKILSMPVGSELLLAGGWRSGTDGHAITYIVERTSLSTYRFVIVNTGDGLKFHPQTAHVSPKIKYKVACGIEDIPASRMADEAWWLSVYSLFIYPHRVNGANRLYQKLLPLLAGEALESSFARSSQDPVFDWRSSQRSGTCYLRCVKESIHYLLRRGGLSTMQCKLIYFSLRYEMLFLAHSDLQVMSSVSDSDIRIMRIACQQLAYSSVKFARLGVFTAQDLLRVKLLAERVIQQVLQLECIDGNSTSPFPTLSMDLEVWRILNLPQLEGLRLFVQNRRKCICKGLKCHLAKCNHLVHTMGDVRLPSGMLVKATPAVPLLGQKNENSETNPRTSADGVREEDLYASATGAIVARRRVAFEKVSKYLQAVFNQESYETLRCILINTGLAENPHATGIPPLSRNVVFSVRKQPLSFPSPYVTAILADTKRRLDAKKKFDDAKAIQKEKNEQKEREGENTEELDPNSSAMTDRSEENNHDESDSSKKNQASTDSTSEVPEMPYLECFESDINLEALKLIPKHIWDVHPYVYIALVGKHTDVSVPRSQ